MGVFEAINSVKTIFNVIRSLSADYNEVLTRASAPPGLPVDNPTVAYWQEDPPFPELVDIQSDQLPETADVVIIGSGITGASVARSILHEYRRVGKVSRRVIVCEARTVCSGATGRNGGHIKSSSYETFRSLCKFVGPERAAALVRFQLRHLDTLIELCRAECFSEAECREVETVDIFLDEDVFNKAVERLEEAREWVPEFETSVWTGLEAQEKFGVNGQVKGALSYRSGALWPYRLVTCVWKKLLEEFSNQLSIETSTPVQRIELSTSPDFPYSVTTSRGTIQARHVVHATNAFAPQLVPGLRGKATGIRAHMSSQPPGNRFPDMKGQRSWSIMYAGAGFDYVSQRPSTEDGVPGDIMLGGGFAQSAKQGMDQIGVYDDSRIDALTTSHNLGIMPTIFEPNWGVPTPSHADSRAIRVWSGIISFAADLRPLVGKLDPRTTGRKAPAQAFDSAEWIAASFIGDGMVWAWLSGTALGLMITGSQDEKLAAVPGRPGGRLSDWFPEELLPTQERIKKMDLASLAEELM